MTDVVDSVTQSLPISEEQKQTVADKADQVKSQVSGQIVSQVGTRASQAGEQVTDVAQALRTTAQQLEGQGQTAPANMVNMAADRAEQVGNYLSSSDPNQILQDVEDFCRQQPWVVVAGGIALGFLGARFLKASSSRRYQSSRSGYSTYVAPYGSDSYAGPYGGYTGSDYGDGYGSTTAYAPDRVTETEVYVVDESESSTNGEI